MSLLGQISLPSDYKSALSTMYEYFRKINREFTRMSYRGQAVWNPAALGASATATHTIGCTGARVGDAVRVFPPYDLQGVLALGYVSADDVVTVVLLNPTAGSVDLASGTWSVMAEKFN